VEELGKLCSLDLAASAIYPVWSSDLPQCVVTCPSWDTENNRCSICYKRAKICEPAVAQMRRSFVASQILISNLTIELITLKTKI
jgi:hypothetical protein